jgi:hypothetical protein
MAYPSGAFITFQREETDIEGNFLDRFQQKNSRIRGNAYFPTRYL